MIKGIDISHWQSDISWELVPDLYKFAFMKATEGTGFVDDRFARNWPASKPRLRGAYHFWRYHFDGGAQAEHFFDIVSKTGDLGELPPVVDLEDCRAPKGGDIVIRMRQMLQRTEELFGVQPIIYTAKWWWNDWTRCNTGFGSYPLWVAHYRPTWFKPYLPAGWDDWKVWQHSSSGKVSGIGSNVDLNVAKDEWYESYVTPDPPVEGHNFIVIAPEGDTVEVRYA